MCVYDDLLVPSPTCCDFFRQCDNNVEWERPCQEGEDGIRMWFDEDLQVNKLFGLLSAITLICFMKSKRVLGMQLPRACPLRPSVPRGSRAKLRPGADRENLRVHRADSEPAVLRLLPAVLQRRRVRDALRDGRRRGEVVV